MMRRAFSRSSRGLRLARRSARVHLCSGYMESTAHPISQFTTAPLYSLALAWASRAALLTGAVVAVLALPCVFGFNLWNKFQPLGRGTNVLDLEDFIMSQNLLPLGAMILVLFCGKRWKTFIDESNQGKCLKFPDGLYFYCRYILPLIVMVILVWGYIQFFK